MTVQMHDVLWLDQDQQHAWRAYLVGTTLLMDRLDRDLREQHDLSLPEYEILVRLSEAPDRRLRMAELAENASQSRCRLSHTCSRLESKGLVKRDSCPNDKRGVYAHLTEDGFSALDRAARDHVETVRAFFIDVIDPKDLEAVGRAFSLVLKRVGATP
ncbi:MAG: MarR family winged helix-turn-helix transcriptional regulator [Actinomycetes bacterium]